MIRIATNCIVGYFCIDVHILHCFALFITVLCYNVPLWGRTSSRSGTFRPLLHASTSFCVDGMIISSVMYVWARMYGDVHNVNRKYEIVVQRVIKSSTCVFPSLICYYLFIEKISTMSILDLQHDPEYKKTRERTSGCLVHISVR